MFFLKHVVLVLSVVRMLFVAECKICAELEIKGSNPNTFRKYLSGCEVIDGSLIIALVDKMNATTFDTLSFPDLREIRGYFVLYRVRGLTTLANLFPNLISIRGSQLIGDYSFMISHAPDLKEIGLQKLLFVEKGRIRIEYCEKVCHFDYLRHVFVNRFDTHLQSTCDCPETCEEGCIADNVCYKRPEGCHEQCIGCSGPTAKDCYYCKFMREGDTCVSECPSYPTKKYICPYLGECVTKEQCLKLSNSSDSQNKKFFIFEDYCLDECFPNYKRVSEAEGHCERCVNKCKKVCNGIKVQTLDALYSLRHCTHLNGSLILRDINATRIAKDLEENLKDIEEIDGFLKFERSPTIKSLDFLSSLKNITGKELESKEYALYIYENANLEYLWNWTRENSTERRLSIGRGKIGILQNQQLCVTEIKEFIDKIGFSRDDLDINGNNDDCSIIVLGVTITNYTSTSVKIEWSPYEAKENAMVLGYLVSFTDEPRINATYYEQNDTCEKATWRTIYGNRTSIFLKNLKPYTQYSYFIKAFTDSVLTSGRTEVAYFLTLTTDPTEPEDVQISSNSSDSILIEWNPPGTPNGVLAYYNITIYRELDDPDFIDQRNYCIDKVSRSREHIPLGPPKKKPELTCDEECKIQEQEEIDDKFDSLCRHIFKLNDGGHSDDVDGCKGLLYHTDSSQNLDGHTSATSTYKKFILTEKLLASETEYYVKGLEPYTMYIIYMQACNENRTETQLCSDIVMNWQRTKRGPKSDNIEGRVEVDAHTDGSVVLKWREPNKPNGVIVSYEVEYKRTDIGNASAHSECVTRKRYSEDRLLKIDNLYEGNYELRVKAVSLAGDGDYTDIYYFEIPQATENWEIAIYCSLLLILMIVVGVCVMYYLRMKKRQQRFEALLIRDINPDYVGPLYVEDEWEVDRKNVDVLGELGQGTFGTVYSGIIKPRGIECAIKTIMEGANFSNRMEFLNEAAVMKAFNDAHHVVKLLGVVSRGDPPFVIMELMARGDLKSFLRQSRESSQNITCVEMYRMAAEIADGMAYLSGKKFIHRDLATRNCMVAADHTVKIGDFGMARDIYETDYYRKETKGLLPVRWMAPESLADGVFTSDSDVWSYGIVLWEMVTLAEQPYQGLANEQVLQFVVSRGTLNRPDECPDLLWDIMKSCWRWKPNTRPMFIHIVEKLQAHVGPDFKLVSFYHSKTGDELRVMAKERPYNAPAMSVSRTSGQPVVHWRQATEEEEDEEETLGFYGEANRPQYQSFPYQRHRPPSSNFLEEQLDEDN